MANIDDTIDEQGTAPEKSALKSCCAKRMQGALHCFDWLSDLPESHNETDLVEVQFKNTRKGYYRNTTQLNLQKGDIVAVEASPGHDIGEVTLLGRLVLLQMKKNGVRPDSPNIRRVYRKAKPNDLEKYEEAKAREHATMIHARKIAEDLKLNMKIGDVEYQGDGNKAIFYYIADDRVDFRQLIKVLADAFRVRIEMKQIGARQEAGRIGGIGPCGRQLCCSGWMTNFVSVATSAARYQDISLNPQKLAGQCAKLKCCLNFEVDTYVEGIKRLPSKEIVLETKDSTYYHFKSDIFKREISYSTSKEFAANLVTIGATRAFEVIGLNRKGIKPDRLSDREETTEPRKEFEDVVGQDSLTRFDKKKNRNNPPRNRKRPEGRERGEEGERHEGRKPAEGRGERPPRNNGERLGGNRPRNNGENRHGGRPQRRNENRNGAPRDERNDNRSESPGKPRKPDEKGEKPSE